MQVGSRGLRRINTNIDSPYPSPFPSSFPIPTYATRDATLMPHAQSRLRYQEAVEKLHRVQAEWGPALGIEVPSEISPRTAASSRSSSQARPTSSRGGSGAQDAAHGSGGAGTRGIGRLGASARDEVGRMDMRCSGGPGVNRPPGICVSRRHALSVPGVP